MKYATAIMLLLLPFIWNATAEVDDFNGIDLTVKAFYSDYILKYDTIPDPTYTYHKAIQIRMTEKIPDKLLTDTTVMQLGEYYHYVTDYMGIFALPWVEISEKDIGNLKIEMPMLSGAPLRKQSGNTDYTLIRYSYLSPSCLMEDDEPLYQCPQFYAMADFQNYVFVRKGETDSLRITFDIPETLFYLRSDMALAEDEYDPDRRTVSATTDCPPSFFLYYKPAFRNKTFDAGKSLNIDLLWENVDATRSSLTNIEIMPLAKSTETDTAQTVIKRTIEKIEQLAEDLDTVPSGKLEMVVTKQVLHGVMDTVDRSWTWGRAYTDKGNRLIIMDKSDFHTAMPAHEILHLYFSVPEKDSPDWTPYERFIVSEALIEYSATALTVLTTGKDGFESMFRYLEKNGYDRKAAMKASEMETNSAFSSEGSSSWLYYEYIPWHLHQAAQKSGGDEAMLEKVIRLLVKGTNCGWDKSIVGKDVAKIRKTIGI